ncbi:hypothetical protein SVIOM342S_02529 [Streptomyces violaceorubidus]
MIPRPPHGPYGTSSSIGVTTCMILLPAWSGRNRPTFSVAGTLPRMLEIRKKNGIRMPSDSIGERSIAATPIENIAMRVM